MSSESGGHRVVIPGLRKGKLESLTDGIFGTVMTVLVLSLSVPIITSNTLSVENSQLIDSIRGLLPDILAYVISFVILGSFWIRHHTMFHFVSRVDRVMLWLNILFLLSIGFVPFSTALLGRYPLLQPSLLIYGVNLIATSVTSQVVWVYARRRELVAKDSLDERIVSRINRRMTLGPISYAIGIAASFFDPTLTLVIYVVTLAFFVFNTTGGYRIGRSRGAGSETEGSS
ncbi:MAG TPA: TMEM175 family protein [Nitrososphaerales archaeon]|nr:TMEM175 family protein [Nitrososphaerales archaeon]